jgi:hypothetical protein
MAETAAYPYATHLDIKFDPLTLIDVSSLAKTVTDQWYNQTLCKVNESVIRLGVMQGEYIGTSTIMTTSSSSSSAAVS